MAKKAPQETPLSESPEVKVRVLSAALGEEDATYLKGETFTTTADRAAALGSSVEIVN